MGARSSGREAALQMLFALETSGDAIERVIVEGPHTPDMKGKASTSEVGAAVAEAVRSLAKKAA